MYQNSKTALKQNANQSSCQQWKQNETHSVATTWQQAHSYLGQFKNVIQL
jgi:hypothetical protein